jgi:hypothetical protein
MFDDTSRRSKYQPSRPSIVLCGLFGHSQRHSFFLGDLLQIPGSIHKNSWEWLHLVKRVGRYKILKISFVITVQVFREVVWMESSHELTDNDLIICYGRDAPVPSVSFVSRSWICILGPGFVSDFCQLSRQGPGGQLFSRFLR